MTQQNDPAESGSRAQTTAGPNSPSALPQGDVAGSERCSGSASRFLGLFCAGILAGLLAWPSVEVARGFFAPPPIPEELAARSEEDPEQFAAIVAAERIARYQNTALALGIFGVVVGGVLGLWVGATKRSSMTSIVGLCGGAALGAAFGAGGGAAKVAAEVAMLQSVQLQPVFRGAVIHAIGWAIAGVGIGLAVGLSARKGRFAVRAAFAAAVAGVLAGCLYTVLAAVIFPLEQSDHPLPRGLWNQFLFVVLASGLMAASIGYTASAAVRPPKSHSASEGARPKAV